MQSLVAMDSSPQLSILFVHQGCELYGSDRVFAKSVRAVAARWPRAQITVLLPCAGPLEEQLRRAIVHDVRIVALAVLRKSDFVRRPLRLIGAIVCGALAAWRTIRVYDLIYINTVVVIDFLIAAGFLRRACIAHVHEIPSRAARICFSALLAWSRAFVLFNSKATQRSFFLPQWQRSCVIWNGTPARDGPLPFDNHDTLNLLLAGRFNRWKGQELLVQAIALLSVEQRSAVRVRLVGGVFRDQAYFLDRIQQAIVAHGLTANVEMIAFTPDLTAHLVWCDLVVVPSTEPEPFGMVAIEAMAAGRAVIAARHGGLTEIVAHDVTGTLFEPRSAESLAQAIALYLQDAPRIREEGRAAYARFAAEFDERIYERNLIAILDPLIAERDRLSLDAAVRKLQ